MKKDKQNSNQGASLREKAEERINNKHSEKARRQELILQKGQDAEMIKLIHELEVYHIELEMQNEELKLASERAEAATEKYTAIYDFAYTGFFTLDTDGNICELNHSAAKMLGKERSALMKGNFKQFVTMDTRAEFNDFFLKVFSSTSKQTCDVRLIVKGNPSIYVHIEAIISGDEEKCLVTVLDVSRRKQAEGILELKAHEYKLFNELMLVSDKQIIELKKEINHLLLKLGEKEKFQLDE